MKRCSYCRKRIWPWQDRFSRVTARRGWQYWHTTCLEWRRRFLGLC